MIRRREDLERICRGIVREAKQGEGIDPSCDSVVREMALTLDHIQRLRQRNHQAQTIFVQRECELSSEIMGLHPNVHYANPADWLERKKMVFGLMATLARVENRRAQADTDHEKQMMVLHNRLLELLNAHAQLRQYNGNSEDTP